MEIIRSHGVLDVAFDAIRTFFQQNRDQIRKVFARRKIYRKTYHELSVLPDCSLRDLGIPRSRIKSLAMEAAHDC